MGETMSDDEREREMLEGILAINLGEPQFTKGPWEVKSAFVGPLKIWSEGEEIAWVGAESFQVASANARLIAAAPEMFEALEAMIAGYAFLARDLRWPFDEINKAGCVISARAALAKARGDAP